jgi:hypothetical protein
MIIPRCTAGDGIHAGDVEVEPRLYEDPILDHAGTAARAPGPAPDPDGNVWFLQEVTTRIPGR